MTIWLLELGKESVWRAKKARLRYSIKIAKDQPFIEKATVNIYYEEKQSIFETFTMEIYGMSQLTVT